MSQKNRALESLIDIYNAGREIFMFIDGIDKQYFHLLLLLLFIRSSSTVYFLIFALQE